MLLNVLIGDWEEELEIEEVTELLALLETLEEGKFKEREATLLELEADFLPIDWPHQNIPPSSPIATSVASTVYKITFGLSSFGETSSCSFSGPLL